MLYFVYGFYSEADAERPSILEWFDNKEEAEEYAEDFKSVFGRGAWVEEQP